MKSYKRDVLFQRLDTGEMSDDFLSVLPQNLTLRVPDKYHHSYREGIHDTVFEEVKINLYSESPDVAEFLSTPIVPTQGLEDIYEAMKSVIRESWDNSAIHLVGHSSGYDSRIISKIIRELFDEGSISGEVFFVETLGETQNSSSILALQGFDCIAYNKGTDPSMFHEYSFKFHSFFEKFNGISAFPVNQWYDAYKDLSEQGIIPFGKIQGFTGYGGNEVMEYALRKRGFEWYFEWHHYLQLQHFRNYGGEWVHPYWSTKVLSAIRGAKHLLTTNRLALDIARKMVPEAIHIPQLPTKTLDAHRTLHPDLLARAVKSFKESWYGSQVNVSPSPCFKDYSLWWMHYNIASLCEHLVNKGYQIKIK